MSDNSTGTPGTPPPVLVSAIEKLLRPLVRLMLSHQITYPLLTNMLKTLYVDVAEKEFQVNGKRQSDSRINLLTGVHRKDVKRLRAETHEELSVPQNVSAGARIIGQWLGSSDYQDESGKPRPLPLRSNAEDGINFDDLVEKVCKQDIRPRVILDEWLRLGVAHVDDNNRVVLNTGAFTPDKGFDEKVYFFGKNIQDHINASTHNLLGLKPAYFDRSVYYDGLTQQSIDELDSLTNKLGMETLTAVNKQALSLQNNDKEKDDAKYRMNFGVFNFSTQPTDRR